MDKKLLIKLEQKLEKEKENIERQLERFADKDSNLKDDWDTRFPRFNGKGASNAALEQAADEVEEYSNLLPVEYSLELQLKSVNLALKKIKTNKYGICEKCKSPIPTERLKIFPAAKTCAKCKVKVEKK